MAKELTVVAWVKITDPDINAVIFVSGKDAFNGYLLQRSNDVLYSIARAKDRYVIVNGNTGFQGLVGKWTHVAMTYKGNSALIVFKDGRT